MHGSPRTEATGPSSAQPNRLGRALHLLLGASALLISRDLAAHAGYLNTLTLVNKSGTPAGVKVVGPIVSFVIVPNEQQRTVGLPPGQYYLLVRYGAAGQRYTYGRGDAFSVKESPEAYSTTTITLHPVLGGTYRLRPTSAADFGQVSVTARSRSRQPSTTGSAGADSTSPRRREIRSVDGVRHEGAEIDSAKFKNVLRVQRYLSRLGFEPGPINGVMDQATRNAVAKARERTYWLDDSDLEVLAVSLFVLTLPVRGGADTVGTEKCAFNATLEGIDLETMPKSHLDVVRQLFVRDILNSPTPAAQIVREHYDSEDWNTKYYSYEASMTPLPDSLLRRRPRWNVKVRGPVEFDR